MAHLASAVHLPVALLVGNAPLFSPRIKVVELLDDDLVSCVVIMENKILKAHQLLLVLFKTTARHRWESFAWLGREVQFCYGAALHVIFSVIPYIEYFESLKYESKASSLNRFLRNQLIYDYLWKIYI